MKKAKRKNKKQKDYIIPAAAAVVVAVAALAFILGPKEDVPASPSLSEGSGEEITASASSEPADKEPSSSSEESKAPADPYAIPSEPYYGKALKKADLKKDEWYLTFVNKQYVIPEDYKPELSEELFGTYCQLDVRCAPYYIEMYNAALDDGCYLTPFSGYRRISTQKRNFENEMQLYLNKGYTFNEAYDKAATNILPPATSEHNLGIAMDIVSINRNFEDTKEFKWLMENAADYGFILRYPEDKTEITGVQYEPWHWRYVGRKAAQEIMEKGITLEEYLGLA